MYTLCILYTYIIIYIDKHSSHLVAKVPMCHARALRTHCVAILTASPAGLSSDPMDQFTQIKSL